MAGGAYIVDKSVGEIYMVGSSPTIQWEQAFENFKLNKPSEVSWNALKPEYLDCWTELAEPLNYSKLHLDCTLENRESVIESAVRESFNKGSNSCSIRFKPIEQKWGTVEIGSYPEVLKNAVYTVNKQFKGPISESSQTLSQLKKYLRVHAFKITDHYWIEIKKVDLRNDYKDWIFTYKMEYKI